MDAQLKQIKGIGPKRFEQITAKLKEINKTPGDLFKMAEGDIVAQFHLPKKVAAAIVAFQSAQPSSEIVLEDKLASKGIRLISLSDDLYPIRVKEILGKNAPKVLYMWGNLDLLNRPAVGFCGSRNVSEKGIEITADTAQQITKEGWVVISGHARGVDTTAHRTAIENGGSTIIVIPEGIQNFKLRSELKKRAKPEQILIISEFKPTAHWNVGYAMQRNNTIVALSDAMILVEARETGGTFAAGETALRLKVPLFVIEYQIPGAGAAGNVHFLKKGASAILKNRETGRANIETLKRIVLEKYQKAGQADVKEEISEAQLPLFSAEKKLEIQI